MSKIASFLAPKVPKVEPVKLPEAPSAESQQADAELKADERRRKLQAQQVRTVLTSGQGATKLGGN